MSRVRPMLIGFIFLFLVLPATMAVAQTTEMNALMDSARVAMQEQRFEDAVRALEQIKATPSFGRESYGRRRTVLSRLARSYGEQNKWEHSSALWEEFLQAAAAQDQSQDQEVAHFNLGIELHRIGRYADAEAHLRAAEQFALARKDSQALANIYAECLALAQELQVPADIQRYEDLVSSLSNESSPPAKDETDALAREAQQAASQNHVDEAIALQHRALVVCRVGGRKRISLLVELGMFQVRKADFQGALVSFRSAAAECNHPGLRAEAAICALKIGEVYFEMARYDSASVELTRAVMSLDNTEAIANGLYNLGLVHKARGEIRAAAASFIRSVLMFEITRSNVSRGNDEERRRVYMSSRIVAYEQCIGALSELRLHESAFKVMELAQARTLSESLHSLESEQPPPRITIAPDTILYCHDPAALLDDLYRQTGGMDLTDVCVRFLDRESAMVEFFLGRDRAFALVAHDATGEVVELQPPDRIDGAVDKFRAQLSHRGGASSLVLPVDSVLSNLVLSGVWSMIKEKSHLFIIPNGSLWVVPFESLIEPSEPHEDVARRPHQRGVGELTFQTAPFLVRRFEFTYGQSACILGSTAARPRTPPPMLIAFADPSRSHENMRKSTDIRRDSANAALMFASREVHDIAHNFSPQCVRLFTGRQATEQAAKQVLDTAGAHILHFATHGFLSRDGGRRVGLVLDRTPGEDGILESAEIARMRIHSDIVVLSACETGLGERVPGEGTMGLARAFVLAGARVVVVSLWEVVDQSTSQLMGVFYRELRRTNGDVPLALHEAQQALLSSEKTAAPFYWAPFIAIGL